MEPVFCVHCAEEFTPRNRLQSHCSKPECQRARKAAWQRIKLRADPDFRAAKKLSQRKWAANNPGYWKNYRADHPEKAERNRMLQSLRNRKRQKGGKGQPDLDCKDGREQPIEFSTHWPVLAGPCDCKDGREKSQYLHDAGTLTMIAKIDARTKRRDPC